MKAHVFFVPHPPIILPEIGGKETEKAKATIDSMHKIGKEISFLKPDTIVFISPHGNTFKNGICMLYGDTVQGDFGSFGYKDIKSSKKVDLETTKLLGDYLDDEDHSNLFLDEHMSEAYQCELKLDHGVLVPMFFIDQYYSNYEIVHITPGLTKLDEQYRIGKVIQKALNITNKRFVIIASGDLSHCLTEDGPYHFHKSGAIFDQKIVESLTNCDPLPLVTMDLGLVQNASQCGLRSFIIGQGILDGFKKTSTVYSYEGPFGVGYITAYMKSVGSEESSKINTLDKLLIEAHNGLIALEDDYIKLARASINNYVKLYEKINYNTLDLSSDFIDYTTSHAAGVFVSIHSHGNLRGCIGTIKPVYDNIMEEIIYNAIQSCSKDPRFNPIEEPELKELEIKVDILSNSEKINSIDELDPKIYGVIISKGQKRGLLLPNLDGIDTAIEQVRIATQKAGLMPEDDVTMFRFKVERHEVIK